LDSQIFKGGISSGNGRAETVSWSKKGGQIEGQTDGKTNLRIQGTKVMWWERGRNVGGGEEVEV